MQVDDVIPRPRFRYPEDDDEERTPTQELVIGSPPASQAAPPRVPISMGVNFGEYVYPRSMDKSGATHHTMFNMDYFNIPINKEPAIARVAVTKWLRKDPLCLCEHIPLNKRYRFYLDIDCSDNLNEVAQIATNVLVSQLSRNDITRLEQLEYLDLLKEMHVVCTTAERSLCVCLRSHNADKNGYHLVWPYLYFGRSKANVLLQDIRKEVSKSLVRYPTSKIEHPPTLRAPFCDKAENLIKAGRPYQLFCCFDSHGRMPPYPDQNPAYPFTAFDDNGADPVESCLAIWAMTSIRFPVYCAERMHDREDYSEQRERERYEHREQRADATYFRLPTGAVTNSATEWYNNKCRYSSMDLQGLLDQLQDDPSKEQVQTCVVEYINSCCAICMFGDISIATKQEDTQGYFELNFLSVQGAKLMMTAPACYYTVEVPCGDGKTKKNRQKTSPYALWIDSPHRREIQGVVFDASGKPTPDKIINTWSGFRYTDEEVEDRTGFTLDGFGPEDVLNHDFNVLCNKELETFVWLQKWKAFQLQNPGVPTASAVVCAGDEGSGKSIAFDAFAYLLGRHAMVTCNIDDLVGRFNCKILGKIFILINELDILDKKQNACLKSLITDDVKRTEAKFRAPIFVSQACNIAATTNKPNENILDVGAKARRYMMLLARTLPHCDREYFNKFVNWLKHDGDRGYKTLFRFYRHLNIDGFDTRTVPATKLLLQHKLSNMPSEHQFFWECITKGHVMTMSGDVPRNVEWVEGRELQIEELNMFYGYSKWCAHLQKKPSSQPRFLMLLKEVVNFSLRRVVLQDFVDYRDNVMRTTYREVVMLPSLPECLDQFSNHYTHMARLRPLHANDDIPMSTADIDSWVNVPVGCLSVYNAEEFAAKFKKHS